MNGLNGYIGAAIVGLTVTTIGLSFGVTS